MKKTAPTIKHRIGGTTFDQDGFDRARRERWEPARPLSKILHCKKHDTYFRYEGADGEPCWQCWNEFVKDAEPPRLSRRP